MSEGRPAIPRSILAALNDAALAALREAAVSIRHPGESGRAREAILADYIRRFIPHNFGVSTGFVIDSSGGISRQVDLVIYRRDYHPVLELGGLRYFVAESVVAVAEVKADMAATDRLEEALEVVASVKRLDRTAEGKNRVLVGGEAKHAPDPELFHNQIFGALVTERSLKPESVSSVIRRFFEANPRRLWPNAYADVHLGTWTYVGQRADQDRPHKQARPDIATAFGFEPPDAAPPLIRVAFEILNFLRVAVLIDYSVTDYLNMRQPTRMEHGIDVTALDGGPRMHRL